MSLRPSLWELYAVHVLLISRGSEYLTVVERLHSPDGHGGADDRHIGHRFIRMARRRHSVAPHLFG
ncbi:MAG: hypothetical protein KF682_03550 [Nitrospira sp.]|nr:hypothetical protein [Nitrospira sp.]